MRGRIRHEIGLISDKGKVRENNEDYVMTFQWKGYADESVSSCTLLVLADGVGGGPAGQIASKIAVESFSRSFLSKFLGTSPNSPSEMMSEALQESNSEVVKKSAEQPEYRGMATTLTAAFVVGTNCYVVHVGDSRCYLIRHYTVEQLTRDQSIGRALQQALGTDIKLPPFGAKVDLQSGDYVIICSDGLWNLVNDANMLKMVRKNRGAASICERLVREANERGGTDNISIAMVRI